MSSLRRPRTSTLIAIAAVLFASACGASGGGSDGDGASPDTTAPVEAPDGGGVDETSSDEGDTGGDDDGSGGEGSGGDASSDDEFGASLGDGSVGSGTFTLSGAIEDTFMHGIDGVIFSTSGGCGGPPADREMAAGIGFLQEGATYPLARLSFEADPTGDSPEGTFPADDVELEFYDEDGTITEYEGEGEVTISDVQGVGGNGRTTVAFTGSIESPGGTVDIDGSWVWLIACG